MSSGHGCNYISQDDFLYDCPSAENTPIEGTTCTASEIADGDSENYYCMQGIDYSAPSAQAFINSWTDEFAP